MKWRPIDKKRIQYNNTQSEYIQLKERLKTRYEQFKKQKDDKQIISKASSVKA